MEKSEKRDVSQNSVQYHQDYAKNTNIFMFKPSLSENS
jgi:hypothetical protein